jgi:hypothetical protein
MDAPRADMCSSRFAQPLDAQTQQHANRRAVEDPGFVSTSRDPGRKTHNLSRFCGSLVRFNDSRPREER